MAGRLSSATLFGDRREVVILHRGQEYRLRITRSASQSGPPLHGAFVREF